MDRFVRFVRWFNRAVPWNKFKYTLTDQAAARLAPAHPAPGAPQVYEGIQGSLRMKLDLGIHYHRLMYLNAYEIVTLRLMEQILQQGDAYIDGGANVGLMALLAARRVGPTGRVYAFEPLPATVAWLRENLTLNHADNVVVVPKGCWHEDSTATLYEFAQEAYPTHSMGKRGDKAVGEEATIQTTRIDAVVPPPAAGGPPVKLIKLDVEGAEWSALRGAEALLRAPRKPHLLLELNALTAEMFGYRPMDMIDWLLREHGPYRLHLIRSKRRVTITPGQLRARLEEQADRTRNLWMEPTN